MTFNTHLCLSELTLYRFCIDKIRDIVVILFENENES